MGDRRQWIWRGAKPLIGTVVGVGIFGLPYVFSQAGFVFGLLELLIIALLTLLTFTIFSDLLAISPGHVRYVAVVSNQLGPFGRGVATLGFFGSLWGTLLAYVLVGGEFLHNVAAPLLGGSTFTYQLLFWGLASLCMVGGTLFVQRLQTWLIPLFFVMVVALSLFALPHLHVTYLTALTPNKALLPLGALAFALSGLSAVPECRDALGRNQRLMRSSLVLGVSFIACLYGLFSFAIVGMTGPFTSVQAVDGLRFVAGPWLSIFVSLIGVCISFTAFLSIGNAVINSLIYDFRGRFLSSWWLSVAIPLCLFLFGARDFIHVIGITGGLLGGVCGIVLLVAYERARLTAQLPKRALAIPQELVALCFVLFVGIILLTIVQFA